MRLNTIIGLLFTALFVSCGKQELVPSEYVRWTRNSENGLRQSFESVDYRITAQYKTPDYMFCLEKKTNNITKGELENRVKSFEGITYFELEFEAKSGFLFKNDAQAEIDPMNFLMNELQASVFLLRESDTIQCNLYHYEHNYTLANKATCLLGFPCKGYGDDSSMELHVIDMAFARQLIKFNFDKKNIDNIPILKTNE
jgi:hypothetical protein